LHTAAEVVNRGAGNCGASWAVRNDAMMLTKGVYAEQFVPLVDTPIPKSTLNRHALRIHAAARGSHVDAVFDRSAIIVCGFISYECPCTWTVRCELFVRRHCRSSPTTPSINSPGAMLAWPAISVLRRAPVPLGAP